MLAWLGGPHLGPPARPRGTSCRRGAHRRRGRTGAVCRAGGGVPGLQAAWLLRIRSRVLHAGAARRCVRRAGNGSPTMAGPAMASPTMAGPGWTAGAATPAGAAAAAAAGPSVAGPSVAGPSVAGPSVAGEPASPASQVPPSAPPPSAPAGMSPQITAAMPRAGFWVRMGALFLDVVLVGFAMSLLHLSLETSTSSCSPFMAQ